MKTLTGHYDVVWSVAFSTDGTQLLTGSWDHTAKLWDATTGELLRTFEGNTNPVASVAFSADGARIVTGASRDGTVKLWETSTGALLRSIDAHRDYVRSVAFSPDGTRLVSGGEDQTAKVWDASSGALLLTLKGHTGDVISVAFSPDGKRLLTASWDKTAKLWDVATGALIRNFVGHAKQVSSAVFSADGSRVLTSSWDGTAKLWDANTGALLRSFTGHADRVFSAAISPDGARVITGSKDTTLALWSVETGKLLARLLARPDGEWLTVTPQGFYTASPKGAQMLGIVRGLKVYSLGQLAPALNSAELVKATLTDEPQKMSSPSVSLETMLDSGPAPRINLEQMPEFAGELVHVTVTLTDVGGGIGDRLVWRVKTTSNPDGELQGRPQPEELKVLATPSLGRTAKVSETLHLDPNRLSIVEVTAFNGKGMLATAPLSVPLDPTPVRTGAVPH